MSKLLRSELKSIVKECLVEILSEGIGGISKENKLTEQSMHKSKNTKKTFKQRKKRKKVTVNTELTENPVLNEMLKETASTTLIEQIEADRGGNLQVMSQGDAAAKEASMSTPEDLFGETSDKWASLAFS